MREVAFLLRDSIQRRKRKPLPDILKVEDVLKGEMDTPDVLKSFFCHLITGPRLDRGESARKKRRIDCLSLYSQ